MLHFRTLIGGCLVAGMLLLPQCSCPPEEQPAYTFRIPVKLDQPEGRYQVGEVLWLETMVPGTSFTDAVTGEQVSMPSAVFSFDGEVAPRESVSALTSYPFEFLLDTVNGSYRKGTYLTSGGTWGQRLAFDYGCFQGADPYRIRLGIKFNYPGIYKIQLPASEQGYVADPANCLPADFTDRSYLQLLYQFDHVDMHLDLFNKAQSMAKNPSDPDAERKEIKAQRAFWLEVTP